MTRLEEAVRDLEQHAATAGWDAPPRLYALVEAPELNRTEPELAQQLGVSDDSDRIVALEQPDLPLDKPIEDVLHGIEWPGQVAGCALILERILLPEGAEEEAPDDDPVTWAARHPGREDIRIVVGVLRDGSRYSAMRLRGHDNDGKVLTGPDLVPHLTDALATTLS